MTMGMKDIQKRLIEASKAGDRTRAIRILTSFLESGHLKAQPLTCVKGKSNKPFEKTYSNAVSLWFDLVQTNRKRKKGKRAHRHFEHQSYQSELVHIVSLLVSPLEESVPEQHMDIEDSTGVTRSTTPRNNIPCPLIQAIEHGHATLANTYLALLVVYSIRHCLSPQPNVSASATKRTMWEWLLLTRFTIPQILASTTKRSGAGRVKNETWLEKLHKKALLVPSSIKAANQRFSLRQVVDLIFFADEDEPGPPRAENNRKRRDDPSMSGWFRERPGFVTGDFLLAEEVSSSSPALAAAGRPSSSSSWLDTAVAAATPLNYTAKALETNPPGAANRKASAAIVSPPPPLAIVEQNSPAAEEDKQQYDVEDDDDMVSELSVTPEDIVPFFSEDEEEDGPMTIGMVFDDQTENTVGDDDDTTYTGGFYMLDAKTDDSHQPTEMAAMMSDDGSWDLVASVISL